MSAFGREVDRIRRAKDITLAAFGAAVQRSEGSVSRILRGDYGESTSTGRRRKPVPPLGKELEMWFDVLGTDEADEPLLRLLAGAAYVPDEATRIALETMIIERFRGPKLPPEGGADSARGTYRIGARGTAAETASPPCPPTPGEASDVAVTGSSSFRPPSGQPTFR